MYENVLMISTIGETAASILYTSSSSIPSLQVLTVIVQVKDIAKIEEEVKEGK